MKQCPTANHQVRQREHRNKQDVLAGWPETVLKVTPGARVDPGPYRSPFYINYMTRPVLGGIGRQAIPLTCHGKISRSKHISCLRLGQPPKILTRHCLTSHLSSSLARFMLKNILRQMLKGLVMWQHWPELVFGSGIMRLWRWCSSAYISIFKGDCVCTILKKSAQKGAF